EGTAQDSPAEPAPADTGSASAADATPPPQPPDQTVVAPGPGSTAPDPFAAVVAAAIDRWAATGLTAEQVVLLRSVTVSFADLRGRYLGEARPGHTTLDPDAAGRGWFLDPTPADDSEFSTPLAATRLDGGPGDRLDLLTTVMHEFGHQLGLD